MLASLLLAATAAAPVAAPAANDPATLLPPDALVYFGSSGAQDGPVTAMDRILGEPEVKAFLEMPIATVDAAIDQMLAENGFEDYRGRLSMRDLLFGDATVGRAFLGLTHIGVVEGLPDVGLVVGLEMLRHDDLEAVRALWGAIPAEETTHEHAGQSYLAKTLASPEDPDDSFTLSMAFLDDMVVLGTSETSVHEVLERAAGTAEGSLAGSPEYAALMARAGGGAVGSASFVRLGPLVGIARDMMTAALAEEEPEAVPFIESCCEGTGLLDVSYFGSAGHLDADGRVLETAVLSLEQDARGLIAALLGSEASIDRAALERIPGGVLSASVFSLSGFDTIYDYVMDLMDQVAEVSGDADLSDVDAFLDELMGGASLRDDVLANMSGTAVSYALPGQGAMAQPAQVFAVDMKDPDAFVTALRNMVSYAAEAMGQPIELRTSEGDERTIYELDVAVLTMGTMMPAFTFEEQRMTMALDSKSTLEDVLAGRVGEGELLDDEDLASFLDEHAGEGSLRGVSWADTAKTFGNVYGQFAMMGQMFGAGIDMPLDLSLMPSEQAITKHLRPSYSVTVREGERVVTQSVGQFTVSDLLTAALPIAAVFGLQEAGIDVAAPEPAVDPREEALSDMAEIKAAITIYRISEGEMPTSLDQLTQPMTDFPEGALGKELPVDPWGNAYRFAVDGRKSRVWSAGPDGVDEGGEGDDIVK